MIDQSLFRLLLITWCILAIAIFVVLLFVPVPYGKIKRRGWGPLVKSSPAWFVMESVSWAGMAVLFATGINWSGPYAVFFVLWSVHYVYRALLFPFLRGKSVSGMPAAVMVSGMGFNSLNAFFNGYWLFHQAGGYGYDWFADVRFLAGIALFSGGFIINIISDRMLRKLRGAGDNSYKIPMGGLFRFVSCPNYLGEILEWLGWALLTWSPAGAAFALWTIANLAPRALSYHTWYKRTFPEYPANRKALIPFIL
jgi:3-oxo-5-alpha-steroid 4-dehydrogenase 1